MGNDYVGRIDPADEAWESSPWTELLKERYHIASLGCNDKVVLDSCCGTGWGTLNYIVPHASFTIGFDLCQPTIESGKYFNKCSFSAMDARRMSLEDNSVDISLSLDAIEHFSHKGGIAYLLEMNRVCRTDGLVIGSTPLVIDESLISTFLQWNKYHKYMYTRKRLQETLKGVFPVVRIYEIYNKVCPYFMFICGNSKVSATAEIEREIKGFIRERKEKFRKVKLTSYLSWSKQLIKKRRFIKAGYLFCVACCTKMGIF